jgi:hypothetical protein
MRQLESINIKLVSKSDSARRLLRLVIAKSSWPGSLTRMSTASERLSLLDWCDRFKQVREVPYCTVHFEMPAK